MRGIKSAVFVLAVLGVLTAQMPPMMGPMMFNPFFGLTPPGKEREFKVGSWAKYKITSTDKEANFPTDVKISLVGQEKRDGKTYFWMEMETHNRNGDHDIVKYLTNFDYRDTSSVRTFSVIFKHNDQPAVEFEISPSQMKSMTQYASTQQTQPSSSKPEAKPKPETDIKMNKETIKVPAGTFECQHIVVDTDEGKNEIWFSDKVPVVGVVKMKFDTGEAVLTEYGNSGAKSAITETPQKINANMMFPPMTPGSMPPGGSSNPMEDAIKNFFGR